MLRSAFSVTVGLKIKYSNGANTLDSITRNFTINYDSAHPYNSRSSFVFSGAHKVTVTVMSVTSNVSAWDPVKRTHYRKPAHSQTRFRFFLLQYRQRYYREPSGDANADELPVSWAAVLGADNTTSNGHTSIYMPCPGMAVRLNPPSSFSTTPPASARPPRLTISRFSTTIPVPCSYASGRYSSKTPAPSLPPNGVPKRHHQSWVNMPSWAMSGRSTAIQYQLCRRRQTQSSAAILRRQLRNRQTVTKDNTPITPSLPKAITITRAGRSYR